MREEMDIASAILPEIARVLQVRIRSNAGVWSTEWEVIVRPSSPIICRQRADATTHGAINDGRGLVCHQHAAWRAVVGGSKYRSAWVGGPEFDDIHLDRPWARQRFGVSKGDSLRALHVRTAAILAVVRRPPGSGMAATAVACRASPSV